MGDVRSCTLANQPDDVLIPSHDENCWKGSGIPVANDPAQTFAALEPLAGALLAIALAYIALPDLRYRTQVNEHAKRALRRLDELNPREDKCKTHYGRLVKFAEHHASKGQMERLAKNGSDIPDTEDASPFFWLFPLNRKTKFARDTKFVGTLAIFAFTILILGVVQNSNAFGLAAFVNNASPNFVTPCLVILVFLIVIPVFLVVVGRRWVGWARSQIDYLEKQCREDILADEITDRIPSAPPPDMDDLRRFVLEIISASQENPTIIPDSGRRRTRAR